MSVTCDSSGQWFTPGTPVSSTNKTVHHYTAELLLKVAFNTITPCKGKSEVVNRRRTTKWRKRKRTTDNNGQHEPHKERTPEVQAIFSTSVTIRVALVKDPVVSHETEMDGIVITHVTYPSSYIELSIILLKSTLLYSEFYQII